MRTRHSCTLVLLLATALAGCGDDMTKGTNADLAATSADLAVPGDLSTLSCANILTCVAGCGLNLVCQQGCLASGNAGAKSAFDAFAGCVALTCAGGDGGSGPCTSATDSHPACLTCLSDVAAQATTAGKPCHAEYAACSAN